MEELRKERDSLFELQMKLNKADKSTDITAELSRVNEMLNKENWQLLKLAEQTQESLMVKINDLTEERDQWQQLAEYQAKQLQELEIESQHLEEDFQRAMEESHRDLEEYLEKELAELQKKSESKLKKLFSFLKIEWHS